MEAAKNVIAKRYSGALFEAANKANAIANVSLDLKQIQHVFAENRQYIKLILPKVIPSKVKNMFLNTAILKISLHEVTKNFLSMLIKNNRIYVIEYIIREFENIVRDYKNELEIEVTTAVEIEDKKKEKLIDQLQEIFNKKIQLDIVVDKDVLGGLSVKVKSQLLDATLKNKLQRLKMLVLQN